MTGTGIASAEDTASPPSTAAMANTDNLIFINLYSSPLHADLKPRELNAG